MTEPSYLDDSSVRRFEARIERVLDADGDGDGRVVLDRTHFYPEGGGQPHDTGTLASDDETWAVTDVRKADTIYHTITGDTLPEPGAAVVGELDWERRHAHMRYHTAQHLLSAVVLDEYGAETTGNQLYADRAHLDCAYDRFAREDLDAIEARLNDLIAEELPVRWYELDRETAEDELDPERTRIHLLPDSITEVRIVEIDDYDRTACAGTHVLNTREIGEVSVTGRETKGSEEERISFVLA